MKTRISALHEKVIFALVEILEHMSSDKKNNRCVYNATANSFTQHSKMAMPLKAIRITFSEVKNEEDIRQILC